MSVQKTTINTAKAKVNPQPVPQIQVRSGVCAGEGECNLGYWRSELNKWRRLIEQSGC